MAWFIFEANIAHYKELLARETDPEKLAIVRRLLAKEEARLAEFHKNGPSKERKRRRIRASVLIASCSVLKDRSDDR